MSSAEAADVWWQSLPADRRVQICSWITQRGAHHPPPEIPGQIPLTLDPTTPEGDGHGPDDSPVHHHL